MAKPHVRDCINKNRSSIKLEHSASCLLRFPCLQMKGRTTASQCQWKTSLERVDEQPTVTCYTKQYAWYLGEFLGLLSVGNLPTCISLKALFSNKFMLTAVTRHMESHTQRESKERTAVKGNEVRQWEKKKDIKLKILSSTVLFPSDFYTKHSQSVIFKMSYCAVFCITPFCTFTYCQNC